MAYGFSTSKIEGGFAWSVRCVTWDKDIGRSISTTLKEGFSPTRAKATGNAKRWVLFFRRGGEQ